MLHHAFASTAGNWYIFGYIFPFLWHFVISTCWLQLEKLLLFTVCSRWIIRTTCSCNPCFKTYNFELSQHSLSDCWKSFAKCTEFMTVAKYFGILAFQCSVTHYKDPRINKQQHVLHLLWVRSFLLCET